MGAYLSSPVTDKETFEGQGHGLRYGGSSMQGWRKSMEDAHIAQLCLNNDPALSIFGVFDGHGGAEVAKFCQKYLVQEIQKNEEFSRGSLGDSLEKVFHRMDEMLRDSRFLEELEQFRMKGAEEEEVIIENSDADEPLDAMELLTRVLQLRYNRSQANGQVDSHFLTKDPNPIDAGIHDEDEEEKDDVSVTKTSPVEGAAEGASAADSSASASAVVDNISNGAPFTPDKIQVHAGCTAVVALKRDNDLFVANAGDSRGVLSRNGVAVALSEDHKPAHEIERSRIIAAGGFLADIGGVCRVNGNLNLSRAIGDLKYKCNQELPPQEQIITAQPDVKIVRLQAEDEFFILACDGVWDVMTNQDAVNFVSAKLKEGLGPSEAASALLDACLANNPQDARGVGCDNMTAVVVQLTSPPAPAAAEPEPVKEEACEPATKSDESMKESAAVAADGSSSAAGAKAEVEVEEKVASA